MKIITARNRPRMGDQYLGQYQVYNKYGDSTSKVVTVTNVKLSGGRTVPNAGWMTVDGKLEGAPFIIKAIDDGILRRVP